MTPRHNTVPTRIVALSGSLRAQSTNTALLRAASILVPDGTAIDLYENLGALPLFNPDRESALYQDNKESGIRYRIAPAAKGLGAVRQLCELVRDADGLLVACPEYARGVPGAFKNALDWLVGSDGFVNKPFTLFNASPRASHAQASLRLTLETMSGRFVESACITLPLLNRGLTPEDIIADPALSNPISRALAEFSAALANDR